jgi:pimeloyl-ACP methyl ester carboxylesterase
MTPDQIIATVAALLAGQPDPSAFPVITAGGADDRYPVAVAACPRPLPPGDIEGHTVICGTVDVPERHGDGAGRRISLAFAVLKSRSLSPAGDPVIYLHGGPGGGAVAELTGLVAPLFDHFRERRDVVTFDQRAAGISSDMVTCFQTFEANIFEVFTGQTLEGETGTQDGSAESLLTTCLEELKENRDIAAYVTPQNARDVQALMRTLGYQTWNLYGISYGTTLALEVMRTAPEGTRAVVIDSVSPQNSRAYDENVLPLSESITAVVELCAADSACAAAYPDLRGTILRVADELDRSPIPAARGRGEVTLATLVSLFKDRNSFNNWPDVTAHIPLILTEWDRGDTTTWDMITSGGTAKAPSMSDRLKPFETRLTPEQRALAAILLEGASAGRTETVARAAAVAALEASLARVGRGATGLAARFDAAVTQAIVASNDRDAMLGFAQAYAALTRQVPSRATLEALVRDHLPATDVEPTLGLLAQMTDGDVAEVFSAVGREFRDRIRGFVTVTDLALVACQEGIPFNSREGFDAFNAALPWPFLARPAFAGDNLYGFCAAIPPALPYEGFHDPIVSDIPTLVLWGSNDTQTSMKDAKLAAGTLTRSQVVGFPEAGHGVILFSKCAKDVGLAFMERPEEQVDTSCTEALKPAFVLPPE